MDLIVGMKTFVAAVEAGSFTAAADRLGISKKLVSKYVGELEDRLKVRLLHRTTRKLSPTEAGQQYYSGCVSLLADMDALESRLAAGQATLTGTLRVTAPVDLSMQTILPAVERFQDAHPDVTIDMELSDRYVDLASGGFDLAIRVGAFEDSRLVTRKLCELEVWTIASPEFLSGRSLASPKDLRSVPCLQDTNARDGATWLFDGDEGPTRVPVSGTIKINSALAMRKLALSGRGVAVCPDIFVAEDVAAGRLVRLFETYRARKIDIRAVYLSASKMPVRQRMFIEHLVRHFTRSGREAR